MSEEFEIKKLGAEPVKNSGRSRGVAKGDAVLEPFLVDIKEYSQSFSVSRDNWGKLSSDAVNNGRREPMFLLALGAEDKAPIRLWVVSDSMGKEMLEAWREKYND